jgi:membrane protein implicated in regulation of membrane protease activity
LTTYLVIGVVGLVLLTVSLVAGDLLDGAFDALSADWFSSAVIGGFVSAFGFGGALADALGAPGLVSLPVGVAAGLVFAWFASWLTRVVRGGGSGEAVRASDTVGHDATVLTDIPSGGFGVVRVRVGVHTLQLNARAEEELPAGTQAHVTGVLSPTAVTVAPTWTALP